MLPLIRKKVYPLSKYGIINNLSYLKITNKNGKNKKNIKK